MCVGYHMYATRVGGVFMSRHETYHCIVQCHDVSGLSGLDGQKEKVNENE